MCGGSGVRPLQNRPSVLAHRLPGIGHARTEHHRRTPLIIINKIILIRKTNGFSFLFALRKVVNFLLQLRILKFEMKVFNFGIKENKKHGPLGNFCLSTDSTALICCANVERGCNEHVFSVCSRVLYVREIAHRASSRYVQTN